MCNILLKLIPRIKCVQPQIFLYAYHNQNNKVFYNYAYNNKIMSKYKIILINNNNTSNKSF